MLFIFLILKIIFLMIRHILCRKNTHKNSYEENRGSESGDFWLAELVWVSEKQCQTVTSTEL